MERFMGCLLININVSLTGIINYEKDHRSST